VLEQVCILYFSVNTGINTIIGWRGYTWGAVSTVAVGGMAAGAAFGIVRALEGAK
jgi:hypothetical protein